jgi:asparagine synthase (glutamine-hydrolysing)
MCGIAGLFVYGGAAEENLRREALAMSRALARRGPDGAGLWLDAPAGVALAHRRLAILDASPAGAQPMVSAAGRHVIVFNGEVTNAPDLARRLDLPLRGRSDTEVLLEHWARFGVEQTLAAIEGMFALAVFDRAARVLTLARDGFGIKPLCWFRHRGQVVFASDIAALERHSACPDAIDPAALGAYLRAGAVPAPWSILAGVRKLLPGEMLTVRPGRDPESRRFWTPGRAVRAVPEGNSEHGPEAALALLERSVARNLVADRPVGVLLSSGLDSAVIAALARRHAGSDVPLFTMGFDDPAVDETAGAAETAAALGCRHEVFRASGADALEVATGLADVHDEPFADSSTIPTVLLARRVAGKVGVALGGDGGDEIFGGYRRYVWARQAERYRAVVPLALRRVLARAARHAPLGVIDGLAAVAGGVIAHAGHKLVRAAEIGALESGPLAYRAFTGLSHDPLALMAEPVEHLPPALLEPPPAADPLLAMQAMDAGHYLPDVTLTKLDRASMACGLEVRVPMLDRALLGTVWNAPPQARQQKRLLRHMARLLLPGSCIDRPKKGFRAPLAGWLRRDLRHWCEDLLAPDRLKESGVLDAEAIGTRWREHLAGRHDHAPALWAILAFEAWRRRPQRPAAVLAAGGQR